MKKSGVLIVLSIMLVLILALTFVACNNENSGDDLPEITLTDGMSLDEVKAALSNVKSYSFIYNAKDKVRGITYYVAENGYVIDFFDNGKVYYIANFIADSTTAYYLIREFSGTEEINKNYVRCSGAYENFEENKGTIRLFLKEYLNDSFNDVEVGDAMMTVKDGKLIFDGEDFTNTFFDFNKTKLPIDEFFPCYKDTADEYVEEDDNGDGNGGEDVSGLFEDGMTVSEVRQVLAVADAYMWAEVESNKTVACFFDENFCLYIEESEESVEYLANFLEDGKWYSLYYGIGVSDSELMTRRYTWSATDDEYQDFLQSDGANMADTLLGFVEAGDATLNINNGSALITVAADFENKEYAGKMYAISSYDKSEMPLSEIFAGYKDNAVERVESKN